MTLAGKGFEKEENQKPNGKKTNDDKPISIVWSDFTCD